MKELKHIRLFEGYIKESLDLNKAQQLLSGLCQQFKFKMMVNKPYEYQEIIKMINNNGLKNTLAGSNGLIINNGFTKKGDPDAWGNPNNPLKHSSLKFIIISNENGLLKQFYNKVISKIETIYDTNDEESKWKLKAIKDDRNSDSTFKQLSTGDGSTNREHINRDKKSGSDQEERKKIIDLRNKQGKETFFLASVYLY